ncbi:MAG: hypothetical protein ACPGVU_08415 [Limisphaerales bacterium]
METPSSENRGLPVTHIFAILVALVVLGLLGLKISSDKKEQEVVSEAPVVQPGALPLSDTNVAAGLKGTLVMLNDYSVGDTGLDQLVADRIYSPRLMHASYYSGPVEFMLASNFVMQLNSWNSSQQVRQFGEVAKTIAMSQPGTNSQQVFNQFARVPGGQLILQARKNPKSMIEFNRLTLLRTEQLFAREIIHRLSSSYHDEWELPPAPDGPIEMPETPALTGMDVFKQILAHRVRQWELNGVRYFFCLAGSPKFSGQVQSMFPAANKPLYVHAMNATIDPVKRRFRTITPCAPINGDARSDGGFNTILMPSTNGVVALVEFRGALPRFKLYADWIAEADDQAAHDLLFSPGFDPQNRILLQAAKGSPEQPARAGTLPELNWDERDGKTTLKIPPTQFATVLLVNDPFAEGQRVKVDGNPMDLIRANQVVSALPLPASDQERTIIIGENSGVGGFGPIPLVALAVVIVGIVLLRRRS